MPQPNEHIAEPQPASLPEGIEMRAVPHIGLRETDADGGTRDQPIIEGYGAVFNKVTRLFGDIFEQVAPGAFTATLKSDEDVRALVNHDANQRLARQKTETLRLKVDQVGLHYEIDPPDTTVGRDTVEDVRSGLLDGSSFWFRVKKEQWEERDDGSQLRTLLAVDLYEVGPVTFPAYEDTTVAVRSLAAWRGQEPPAEPLDANTEDEGDAMTVGRMDLDLALMTVD